MKYTILDEQIAFDDHYKIIEAKINYDTFSGGSNPVRHLAFDRGDSVAILLFEKESQSFLFTNQFRYPTCKRAIGWLTEIVAGSLEKGEDSTDCIKKEVLEELGYKINSPQLINTFYTSPGGSNEFMYLYYAEVSQDDKKEAGGGAEQEDEDIQMIRIPVSEIQQKLKDFKDAKTILAIQWYLLNQVNAD